MRFGRLEIDPGSRVARLDGNACALTSYQFDLLVALAENAGRTLSRDQLMDKVKGAELEAFDRSIDVHVSRIRAAIEDDPKHPRRIVTVRGAGYVFARYQDNEG
jgi:DNA-binding response OmpR family regulator